MDIWSRDIFPVIGPDEGERPIENLDGEICGL